MMAARLGRAWGPLVRARPVARCSQAVASRMCSSSRNAATPAAEGFFSRLAREGQIDSGMWQGAALLGGAVACVQLSSNEQRKAAVGALLAAYRKCGLSERITDRQLVEDFVRKNVAAACNVLMASPVFYFMFSKVHSQTLAVSSIRAFTGTLRIVPFMGAFYGFFAIVAPFVTAYFMERGQTYSEAQGTAAMAVMLSGFVFIEAIVELRGCGVMFSQMTASSFVLFIPALVGRLAAGVLTQQQKVGSESEPLLPSSWLDGPTWQQHTYMTFEMLHLDREFLITTGGTTVFQHVLNGITWVLLTRGKSASLPDILKFIFGGMNGTATSGLFQFGKTFVMRFGFGWAWNWCSSQQEMPPLSNLLLVDMPVFNAFLE
ncbi:hypothetical protein AB1Y20_020395 [Prymnesium parvum]|uniref:ADP,ATP carrier protein n=1 Tax=Prymnesium parvum TaxID=97485 RepID=A0AB34JUH6_PRYPA